MKTNKFLREHRVRQTMRFVPLAVALSLTINAAGTHKTAALQTPTSVSQQRLEQGRSLEREIAEGEVHSYRLDGGQLILSRSDGYCCDECIIEAGPEHVTVSYDRFVTGSTIINSRVMRSVPPHGSGWVR